MRYLFYTLQYIIAYMYRNCLQIQSFTLTLFLLLLCGRLDAQVNLTPHHIVLNKGAALDLKIPDGYHISVAAQDMRRLRFLARSPDGQLFCTDMYSLDDTKKGKIFLFEDWDNGIKQFKKTTV